MLIMSSWPCLPSHRILFRAVWGMNMLSPGHIGQLPFWVQEFLFLAPLRARSGQVRGSLNEWMWLSGPVGYQGNLGKLWTLGIMCWESLCLQEKQYGVEEVVIHQSKQQQQLQISRWRSFLRSCWAEGTRLSLLEGFCESCPNLEILYWSRHTVNAMMLFCVCRVQLHGVWMLATGCSCDLSVHPQKSISDLFLSEGQRSEVWLWHRAAPGTRTQQCLNCISKQKERGGRKFLHPHIAQSQRNQGYCSFGEIIKSSVVFQSHGWFFIVNSATCWLKAVCCERRAGCSTPTTAVGSTMCTPTRVFDLS